MAKPRVRIALNPLGTLDNEVAAMRAVQSGIVAGIILAANVALNLAGFILVFVLGVVELFERAEAFGYVLATFVALVIVIKFTVSLVRRKSVWAASGILGLSILIVILRGVATIKLIGDAKGAIWLLFMAAATIEIWGLVLATTGLRGARWLTKAQTSQQYRWRRSAGRPTIPTENRPWTQVPVLLSIGALLVSLSTFMLSFVWKPSGLQLTASFAPTWSYSRDDGSTAFVLRSQLLFANTGHHPAVINHVNLTRRFPESEEGNCTAHASVVEGIDLVEAAEAPLKEGKLPAVVRPGDVLLLQHDFDVLRTGLLYSTRGPLKVEDATVVDSIRAVRPWVLCLETNYFGVKGRELRHMYQIREGRGSLGSGTWLVPVDSPVMRLLPRRLDPLDFHLRKPT